MTVYLALFDLDAILMGVYDTLEAAMTAHPGDWQHLSRNVWRDGVNTIESRYVQTLAEVQRKSEFTTVVWPPTWMTWETRANG